MVEIIKQNFEENKKKFNETKQILSSIFGEKTPIDHVGSTAIPDIYGKNIIDILVGAKDEEEFAKFDKLILKLGYRGSDNNKTNIYRFFASKFGETGNGDTHIHLGIIGTKRYEDFLILRDYLLSHPDEAKKYSDHKKQLIEQNITDRKLYRKTKSKYVEALFEKIYSEKDKTL